MRTVQEISNDINRVSWSLKRMKANRDDIYRPKGYKNARWLLNDLRRELREARQQTN